MKAFLQPLQNLAEMEQIREQAKDNRGVLAVSGCMESQKAHMIYGLSGLFPCHLIISEDERSAKQIYEDYRFYDKKCLLLSGKRSSVFSGGYPRKSADTAEDAGDPGSSYFRRDHSGYKCGRMYGLLAPLEEIPEAASLLSAIDSQLDIDKLKTSLVSMGYERVGQVEMPGQFSVRGGIIDIYSLTEENPWRIGAVGGMRSIQSEALILRARDLWKIWKRLPFIRRRNSRQKKAV